MNSRPLILIALGLSLLPAGIKAVTFTNDTTIAADNSTYDGQPIIVSGCTLTLDGPHTFASVLVTNAGWIRHSDPASNRFDLTIAGDLVVVTNSSFYGNARLIVQGNATIDPGGSLFANARGYPVGTNNGPGAGGRSAWYGAGGGYGGAGGNGNPAVGLSPGGAAYGDPLQPVDRGSAGGSGTGGAGGAGGGAMQIEVDGTLRVDGLLAANGGSATFYWSGAGGGSGGSLWITAGTLAGTGVISANGGDGDLASSVGGGGGGGRIALCFGTNSFSGTLQALGGGGAQHGAPGSIFLKAGTDPVGGLVINAGGRSGKSHDLTDLPFVRLTISNAATAFARQPLSLASLRIGLGGTFTHLPGTGAVALTIDGDAMIDVGGGISADACGYFTSTNAGPGAGSNGGGGAGHGGSGGDKYTGVKGGSAYGSILWPTNFGSRGGDGAYGVGGAGGGAIKLNVGGTLTVNGRLSAEGAPVGIESAAGSGSGGSVLVTAQTLSGSGAISVNGGVGDYSYWYGGGGGAGGRVALRFATNSFAGTMSAQGGTGKSSGGAGTIYSKLANEPFGSVRVDNGPITSFGPITPITTPETFHLLLTNYALVTFPQPATLASLTVSSTGWITFPTNGVPLDLVVLGNATVAAGGQILADAFGYPISGEAGPGVGGTTNGVGSGAGHGGGGGTGSTGAKFGRPYGSATEPTAFGSQGGFSAAGITGAGGGAVRMTVGGTLALQGRIHANGANAVAANAGGSSGGSIYLTVGALSGDGPIWVMGGSGNGAGGGGGGGRISILGNVTGFSTNSLRATGGAGYQAGTNGTIHLGEYLVPRIVGHRPSGFVTEAPDHVDLDFDQGIDPASFTPALVQVSGVSGPIPLEHVSVANVGGRTWRIRFPPQTSNGRVSFTIAPGVRSLFGLATTNAYAGGFDIWLERYLIVSGAGNALRLDWATSVGRTYQLQLSDALTNWADFGPSWPGTGGMIGTNIPINQSAVEFFRLRISE